MMRQKAVTIYTTLNLGGVYETFMTGGGGSRKNFNPRVGGLRKKNRLFKDFDPVHPPMINVPNGLSCCHTERIMDTATFPKIENKKIKNE